jgi:hypothetical protein
MNPKQYELYFLDLSNPSNKSRLEYKYQLSFINNPDYSLNEYHEINNLELGDSCNLSHGNIEHWIRRIN